MVYRIASIWHHALQKFTMLKHETKVVWWRRCSIILIRLSSLPFPHFENHLTWFHRMLMLQILYSKSVPPQHIHKVDSYIKSFRELIRKKYIFLNDHKKGERRASQPSTPWLRLIFSRAINMARRNKGPLNPDQC